MWLCFGIHMMKCNKSSLVQQIGWIIVNTIQYMLRTLQHIFMTMEQLEMMFLNIAPL